MKKIEILSDKIEEELDDAEDYVKKALEYKDEDPMLSDLFYSLAREEMGHMNRLHDMVTKIIKAYRDENGDPPAGMQTLYDFLHRKHIARSVNVQRYLDKYSGKT